ncbi:MAG: class I SAM-dependent methyltransferase [Rhodospirillaceae bacterium]|nr:class I SAM-dependent methyltransferase [Rhodospirillaceae bacterium]
MGILKRQYHSTMRRAYGHALAEARRALAEGGRVLDCGAGHGQTFDQLGDIAPQRYTGVEWSPDLAEAGAARGLDIFPHDLNTPLPFEDGAFRCIVSLSVLEHLLKGCAYLRECRRVLGNGGTLVVLTPNIATYFSVLQLLLGRMTSSGPHPDSQVLAQTHFNVLSKAAAGQLDMEDDTPSHRHLVVFSYAVLKRFLRLAGFSDVRGAGFGYYPFPVAVQPLLERADPWHCHQMVFTARR